MSAATVGGTSPVAACPAARAPAIRTVADMSGAGAAAAQGAGEVVMHDWWLYQVVSGAGGRVIHDPEPSLLYRQHGANVVGANDGAGARLASLKRMLQGRHRDWSRANLREMQRLRDRLTPENRRLLDDFAALTGPGAPARLRALRRGAFYRQGHLSQAALWLGETGG